MNCCTDKADAVDIISWTKDVYQVFKDECPGVLVIAGTDENTVYGETHWPMGGALGRIAADVLDIHPYPILFTPTKGDGLMDSLSQSVSVYDTLFMRAYGSAFVQEFGTLITGGAKQQDSYLKGVLPQMLADGANGFLFWCMRDFSVMTEPYSHVGMESMLGMFDSNDRITPGLEFFSEFAQQLSLINNVSFPEDDAFAVGLYLPINYESNQNHPSILSRRGVICHHFLKKLGFTTRVIRGDLKIPANLKTLVVPSMRLTETEISTIALWV